MVSSRNHQQRRGRNSWFVRGSGRWGDGCTKQPSGSEGGHRRRGDLRALGLQKAAILLLRLGGVSWRMLGVVAATVHTLSLATSFVDCELDPCVFHDEGGPAGLEMYMGCMSQRSPDCSPAASASARHAAGLYEHQPITCGAKRLSRPVALTTQLAWASRDFGSHHTLKGPAL